MGGYMSAKIQAYVLVALAFVGVFSIAWMINAIMSPVLTIVDKLRV